MKMIWKYLSGKTILSLRRVCIYTVCVCEKRRQKSINWRWEWEKTVVKIFPALQSCLDLTVLTWCFTALLMSEQVATFIKQLKNATHATNQNNQILEHSSNQKEFYNCAWTGLISKSPSTISTPFYQGISLEVVCDYSISIFKSHFKENAITKSNFITN